MRLLPKSKIEEIKKVRKQAKMDKKRKVAVRNMSVSFLIVCEGTRTEPNNPGYKYQKKDLAMFALLQSSGDEA